MYKKFTYDANGIHKCAQTSLDEEILAFPSNQVIDFLKMKTSSPQS